SRPSSLWFLPRPPTQPTLFPYTTLFRSPFTTEEVTQRCGLARGVAEGALRRMADAGKLLEGEFRPAGLHREWCDPDVLRTLRRRSLARLRHEVEPVEPPVLGRLITTWQGVVRKRAGL